MDCAAADHARMVKRPVKQKARLNTPAPVVLYIGQWTYALGLRPVDIVQAIGINEGYLSELINNKKKNPSLQWVAAIADFLGIPMEYLRRPPPKPEFIQQAATLDPAVLARLRRGRGPSH